MNPIKLLEKYTADNPELLRILIGHSQAVEQLALKIAKAKNLPIDLQFLSEAAMLHDIGVGECHAPSISCYGHRPYICHGTEGRRILEAEGLPRHALVCERHTGSGLSLSEIISRDLPVPHRDMLPQTLEEKLICYADKFYSKSRALDQPKPLERIMEQMAAHSAEVLARFRQLHALFG